MNINETDRVEEEAEMVLEQLRPRMRTARVGHLRRMAAVVAVVPLIGFGAAAMAADGGTGVTIDAAPVSIPDDPADVGVAGSEEAIASLGNPADETASTTSSTTTTATTLQITDEKSVTLGVYGTAIVVPEGDSFALASIEPAAGWELVSAEIVDGVLVVVIADGEHMKAIKIRPGVRDQIDIRIVDVVIPPTTTKAPPATVSPVVDRWVVEVPGKGSFVVERSGDVLFLGNVTDADGFVHDVVKAEGWKVHVAFTDGAWLWHGKAYIDDAGRVQQHFWDEAKIPDPVYQWVEIPGVGAAKFKLWNNQVYVKETAPSIGFSSFVHTEVGTTVKVDFEGEGQLWFIDVGILEGQMVWDITNATPPPPTTTTAPPPTTTAPPATTAPPPTTTAPPATTTTAPA